MPRGRWYAVNGLCHQLFVAHESIVRQCLATRQAYASASLATHIPWWPKVRCYDCRVIDGIAVAVANASSIIPPDINKS